MKKWIGWVGILVIAIGLYFFSRKQQTVKPMGNPATALPQPQVSTSVPVVPAPSQADDPASVDEPFQSECTEFFQKYLEGRTFKDGATAFLEDFDVKSMKQLVNSSCGEQITERLDEDRMTELAISCFNILKNKGDRQQDCWKLGTLIWLAFGENEHLAENPDEMSAEALHLRIMFRAVDYLHYKEVADKDEKIHLIQLLNLMHEKRPDVAYGTIRSQLMADIYQQDPNAWQELYDEMLKEVEEKSIVEAVAMYYEGHKKLDASFLAYVEGVVSRHPNHPAAHIYRAYALTWLDRWDDARQEADRTEQLDSKKIWGKALTKLREGIQKKSAILTNFYEEPAFIDLPPEPDKAT